MKTWGVVSGLLSGAILAVLLASMNSCSDTYEVGPEGQLFKMNAGPTPDAPLVRGPQSRWDEAFPRFPMLDRWVQPGDRLVQTRTSGGFWIFEVEMRKVEVFRADQSVLLARDGHVRFWATILGLSLFPLTAWGIAALWNALLSPQRHRGLREIPP
ncbi:MAG TPA: hypothetical protein VNM14_09140 [Planctomycetota bacterium]|nr:hypothetical protein [Planctomycetota bacterium]